MVTGGAAAGAPSQYLPSTFHVWLQVELQPGQALLLPAYWYHQIESFGAWPPIEHRTLPSPHSATHRRREVPCSTVRRAAEPNKLNVAINWWFQGHSLATRLYRTLRENLFINCTEPAPPGMPHPCR